MTDTQLQQPEEPVLITAREHPAHHLGISRVLRVFLGCIVIVFAVGGIVAIIFRDQLLSFTNSALDEPPIAKEDAPPSFFTTDGNPLLGFPLTIATETLEIGDSLYSKAGGAVNIEAIEEQRNGKSEDERWFALLTHIPAGPRDPLVDASTFLEGQTKAYAHQTILVDGEYWFIHSITQQRMIVAQFASEEEAQGYPLVWQE